MMADAEHSSFAWTHPLSLHPPPFLAWAIVRSLSRLVDNWLEAGLLDCRLVCWLAGWLAVGWFVGWLVCRLVVWSVARLLLS